MAGGGVLGSLGHEAGVAFVGAGRDGFHDTKRTAHRHGPAIADLQRTFRIDYKVHEKLSADDVVKSVLDVLNAWHSQHKRMTMTRPSTFLVMTDTHCLQLHSTSSLHKVLLTGENIIVYNTKISENCKNLQVSRVGDTASFDGADD